MDDRQTDTQSEILPPSETTSLSSLCVFPWCLSLICMWVDWKSSQRTSPHPWFHLFAVLRFLKPKSPPQHRTLVFTTTWQLKKFNFCFVFCVVAVTDSVELWRLTRRSDVHGSNGLGIVCRAVCGVLVFGRTEFCWLYSVTSRGEQSSPEPESSQRMKPSAGRKKNKEKVDAVPESEPGDQISALQTNVTILLVEPKLSCNNIRTYCICRSNEERRWIWNKAWTLSDPPRHFMWPLTAWKTYDHLFLKKRKRNILCFYFEGFKLNGFML